MTGDRVTCRRKRFCGNAPHAREGLKQPSARLIGGLRRVLADWARPVSRTADCATTSRPHDENAQVSDSPLVSQSAGATREEWAQLAADWGIGGYVNQADEILKRNPAAAPPGAIEAGWRLLDLLEWAGIDSRHPLASDVWRAKP